MRRGPARKIREIPIATITVRPRRKALQAPFVLLGRVLSDFQRIQCRLLARKQPSPGQFCMSLNDPSRQHEPSLSLLCTGSVWRTQFPSAFLASSLDVSDHRSSDASGIVRGIRTCVSDTTSASRISDGTIWHTMPPSIAWARNPPVKVKIWACSGLTKYTHEALQALCCGCCTIFALFWRERYRPIPRVFGWRRRRPREGRTMRWRPVRDHRRSEIRL